MAVSLFHLDDCPAIDPLPNFHIVIILDYFLNESILEKRFGTTLKKHDESVQHKKRRRRQISNDSGRTEYGADTDLLEDEWDIGDLSALDFSQVFEADDSSTSTSGGFLGRRAHHLVDLLAQPDDCLVRHILQIWDSDLDRIRSLDQRQILLDVNAALLQGSVSKRISLSPFPPLSLYYIANDHHLSYYIGKIKTNSIHWNSCCRTSGEMTTAVSSLSGPL